MTESSLKKIPTVVLKQKLCTVGNSGIQYVHLANKKTDALERFNNFYSISILNLG